MDATQRADMVYLSVTESTQKFDSLVLAATLAVCGYLAQTTPFGRLGCNVETMYLVVLLWFAAAAYCGFRRLEYILRSLQNNYGQLDADTSEKEQEAKKASKDDQLTSLNYWYARNGFLYGGFIGYLFVKIFAAYV